MNFRPGPFVRPRMLASLLFLAALLPRLTAQNALYVEHEGKLLLVRGASGNNPVAEMNGKNVTIRTRKFLLKRLDEYRPVLISVEKMKSSTTEGTAEFASAYSLGNVFFAMEFTFPKDDSSILLIQEIGRLKPHEPRQIAFGLPEEYNPREAKFQIHLFVDGMEVFHSQQPVREREAALDRMVADRVKPLHDAMPQPLFGPPAPYPRKVPNPKVPGTATVRFRINEKGVVLDPMVVAATDPAFGEAAVAALWDWRFIPRIRDGKPVESTVDLPVRFDPPGKS
jgi:TonB family protein